MDSVKFHIRVCTCTCRQLSNLAEKLERLRPELANRKGVVFQQDNARLHVSLATRTKLHELG